MTSRSLTSSGVRLCLAVALTVPAIAAGQSVDQAERDAIVRQVTARGGQPADVEPLLRLADQTAADGLPSAPVLNKIREGLAKNVPIPRIEPVVRRLATDLATADRLLGDLIPTDRTPGRQVAVGDLGEALSAGATPEEVRALFGRLSGTSAASAGGLASAARGLALIKDARLPVGEATDVVAEAARQGFHDDDLVALGREVKRREIDYQSGRFSLRTLRTAIAQGERPDRLFPPVRPEPVDAPTRPATPPERPVPPERVDPVRPAPVERPAVPERPQRP